MFGIATNGKGLAATPAPIDVCTTPPGAPVPYPNLAALPDGSGSKNVTVLGAEVLRVGDEVAVSSGDEGGVMGGVVSGTFKGKAEFKVGWFGLKVEGREPAFVGSLTGHNGPGVRNTIGAVVSAQSHVNAVVNAGGAGGRSGNTLAALAVGVAGGPGSLGAPPPTPASPDEETGKQGPFQMNPVVQACWNVLQHSPGLQKQIRELLLEGWRIEFKSDLGKDGECAPEDLDGPAIYINADYRRSENFVATYLAHEVGHAKDDSTKFFPDPKPEMTKEEFLELRWNAIVRAEGMAVLRQFELAEEVGPRGHRLYVHGGKENYRKALASEENREQLALAFGREYMESNDRLMGMAYRSRSDEGAKEYWEIHFGSESKAVPANWKPPKRFRVRGRP